MLNLIKECNQDTEFVSTYFFRQFKSALIRIIRVIRVLLTEHG